MSITMSILLEKLHIDNYAINSYYIHSISKIGKEKQFMKRILIGMLTLLLILSLCACTSGSATTDETRRSTATESSAREETQTVDAAVYADDMFAAEQMAYEVFSDEVSHFEVKITKTTDKEMYTIAFTAQALDSNGDVIESWEFGPGSNVGMDTGRGYWLDCSGRSLADGCKSIEEVSKKVDTIQISSVKIQTIKDDFSWKSWVTYAFQEPPAFRVAELQPKD